MTNASVNRPASSIIATRMHDIKASATMAIGQLVRRLQAQGREILNLGVGEPYFATPDHIKQAAIKSIERGETRYTDVNGAPALRQAISDKFHRENALHYRPEQITVGTGSKQVIYNAFNATLEPGDQVIIPKPYWVSYPEIVQLAQGQPVFVDCAQADDFKLQPATLVAAITERTKWLIINSPNNPSGAVYSSKELQALAEVLLRHRQVWVLSDDIYEHLWYDDQPFSTMAQVVPELYERTLTVNGLSKSYAMTGWRIGYGGGPSELIAAMTKIQSQCTNCPCSISQAAGIAALTGTQTFLSEWQRILHRQRDQICALVNRAEGLDCKPPLGAFYVMVSCAKVLGKKTPAGQTITNDQDFAEFLLEQEGVAVVPGAAFGKEPFVRISYTLSDEELLKAGEKIQHACASLR